MLHACAHDTCGQDVFANSSSNSAHFSNCIYGTQMIFVSATSDRHIRAQSHRSSKQGALHIISGERISGEETINASSFNQPNQMASCTRAHYRWTSDDCDFA